MKQKTTGRIWRLVSRIQVYIQEFIVKEQKQVKQAQSLEENADIVRFCKIRHISTSHTYHTKVSKVMQYMS